MSRSGSALQKTSAISSLPRPKCVRRMSRRARAMRTIAAGAARFTAQSLTRSARVRSLARDARPRVLDLVVLSPIRGARILLSSTDPFLPGKGFFIAYETRGHDLRADVRRSPRRDSVELRHGGAPRRAPRYDRSARAA